MRTVVSVMIALPTASLVLAVLTYSMPATAEEQTLKGRLVVNQPTGISSTLNRATTPRRVETSRVTAPTPSKTVIHSP